MPRPSPAGIVALVVAAAGLTTHAARADVPASAGVEAAPVDASDAESAPVDAEAAKPAPRQHPEWTDMPHHLGLGISILSELGWGGQLRLRLGPVGVEFSATVAPEYFITRSPNCPPVTFEFPYRFTTSVIGYVAEDHEISHSFRAGFFYHGIYRWGGIIGYRAEVRLLDWLVFEGGTGVIFVPFGHELATGALQAACGPDTQPSHTSEVTNRIWIYFGVGMTAYVF